ncbi:MULTISPECIES: NAD(P)/FAD-dependent oxidoreductase [Rhodococcus]|uniref:Pyridine nucleotide-disulfide oxidoreductase domain-containing protein 2 n=1 Tax=Rhodococcus rhodochrous J45 TaxID=935266 RepID=A0A562E2W5_RHORH|nr:MULTISPECIES: NAD(P)/FAD-dependent oxidoreductase [Rhodococcus]OWY79222.1 FAD-dependent oxidoreductase [Rhodococcus sp. BUPNP1]TWH16326.1 phytoene dehydrogenase-like protein [Rhodococcus rhodochrous J45]
MSDYEAVVIGAGPNGLVAANLLADAGWSVLVVEAAAEPGGAVRSAEITAEGFGTDLCSAFYPMGVASPVLAGLDLHRYGLRWRHARDVLAHLFPDDEIAVLSRNVERTAASVARFAPDDARAWRDELALWQRIGGPLLDALLSPFPPIRGTAALARSTTGSEAIRLLRRFLLPARRFGQETFSGDGARMLLAGNAVHSDLGPDDAAGALFGWLLTMLGQTVGFPAPAGGAARITDALVRRLTDRGGTIECGREITGILVQDGRGVGVRDAHGDRIRATRAVLADVPAPTLYRQLLGEEHLPARLLRDLRHFQWDDGTVKVDWALSDPIPWSNPAASGAGTVHLGVDMGGLAIYHTQLRNGTLPDHPFVLLGQMTTTDPSRSPPGTEAVWAYTHVPRDLVWTADRRERFADRIQAVVERHAPGFTGRILGRAVQSPAELEQHNPALVGGAINQGTPALHQQLIFRPTPGLGRADTPVDRVFLAGASAHPGGAVHGAPGANAARAALARDGTGGGMYRTVMRSLQHTVLR